MWASLAKKTSVDLCSRSRVSIGLAAFLIAALAYPLAANPALAQDTFPTLPRIVQDQMNSLASRLAEEIRQSKIDPAYPKILILDFSNAGGKQFSKLGTLLADKLAESLAGWGWKICRARRFA